MCWLDLLDSARYQAEMLDNNVLALEQLDKTPQPVANDPEWRFHAARLTRWIEARLGREHAPQKLDEGPGICPGVLIDTVRSGRGFIARLRASSSAREEDVFAPAMTPAFRAAIRAAETATLRYSLQTATIDLSAQLPRRERYSLEGPSALQSYEVDGASLGATAAVALASRWYDIAVPEGMVVIGAIDRRGAVRPVTQLAEKVATVLRERPRTRLLFVPIQQLSCTDSRIIAVDDVEALFRGVFGKDALRALPPRRLHIEALVKRGVELYEKHNNFDATIVVMRQALEVIEQRREAGDGGHRTDELTALWRLGSALTHRGQIDDASDVFARGDALAEQLWEAELLPPETYFGYRGNRALLLRDTYRYADAERLLRDTLAGQRRARQEQRMQAKTLGNLGELLGFMGRLDEARSLLQQALSYLERSYRDEVPRAHCNLGNLLLRARDARGALEAFERGLAANRQVGYGYRANERYLRYGESRACLALGQPERAKRVATIGIEHCEINAPFPRQLLIACQGLSNVLCGELDAAEALLREAGETSQADGAMLRFGLSTSLGHCALALLDNVAGPRARGAAVVELLRQLCEAARPLEELPEVSPLTARIESLLHDPARYSAELRAKVVQLIRLFPYGIDPWDDAAGAHRR
jgi:tetratricopeptide (TPR) repeat protein